MLIYGLMKYIEKIPARYDRMMNFLTFGGHGRSQKIIMSTISDGMRVLDIGCGSGALAVKCAEAGAEVVAVDSSSQMLSILKSRIRGAKFEKRIAAVECGSASVDIILKGRQFDVVIMSMMLGELSPVVRAKTLKSAAALLSENGIIIICDELWP
ncbi:MAG TPA: class I SAM-dependent methyltransferase, partial [Candidatus Wallbacteria bacterium]|nr:class I SAM-dependent methyltransferase [Candidatus Wallbacteria bacterium]